MKLKNKDEVVANEHRFDCIILCSSGILDNEGRLVLDKYQRQNLRPAIAGALGQRIVRETNDSLFGFLKPTSNKLALFQHKWRPSDDIEESLVRVSTYMLNEYAVINEKSMFAFAIPQQLRNRGVINHIVRNTPDNITGFSY